MVLRETSACRNFTFLRHRNETSTIMRCHGDHEEAELQLASSMLIVSEDIKETLQRLAAMERWRNFNILTVISSWRIESKITDTHYAFHFPRQVHRAIAAPRSKLGGLQNILFLRSSTLRCHAVTRNARQSKVRWLQYNQWLSDLSSDRS